MSEISFTVKELLQEIKGKVEKVEDSVQSLELRGTDRENSLISRVAGLDSKLVELERQMATRVAVEETTIKLQKQERDIRMAQLTAAGSILLVAVEFLALWYKR